MEQMSSAMSEGSSEKCRSELERMSKPGSSRVWVGGIDQWSWKANKERESDKAIE